MNFMNSNRRNGNFTSSEIVALTTSDRSKKEPGKPFFNYVEEKKFERNLKRSLDTKLTARPLSWGKLCEIYLFQNKGLIQYTPLMDEPMKHPIYDFWWGSPDAFNNNIDAVSELKCPQTLKSFCQLVEPLRIGLSGIDAMNHIRDNHSDGDKYYWQIVSNAIITKKSKGELIIFCPQQAELQNLRDLAQQMPAEELSDYYWIVNSFDENLPYLLPESAYNSFNSIVFDIPQEDIDFLTIRTLLAEQTLSK